MKPKLTCMKKATATFLLVLTFKLAFTATLSIEKSKLKANQIFLSVGKSGELISLEALSVIKIKDFEALTGKKMNLMDRIGFKASQNQLRNSIDRDGTFNKKLQKYLNKKKADGTTGFHSGGFFLGFLVGLVGVIIAYAINDEKKKNRVKWSWIGYTIRSVIVIVLLIIAISSGEWFYI